MNAEDARLIVFESAAVAERAARRLEQSLTACAPLFPADAAAYEALDGLALERLDALGVRYARCQELLGKALRSCAAAWGAPTKSFSAMIDGLRGEGLVLPITDWTTLRGLRNTVGHAHLTSSADFAAYFKEIAAHGPNLVAAVAALNAFIGGKTPRS